MTVTLALAGDAMLGRKVGERVAADPSRPLVADDVVAITRQADLFLINLECCLSDRGRRWPDPRKPFFFRGPPEAVGQLQRLGVDAVTLANNHALDYGEDALLDTIRHLDTAGIASVGAGEHLDQARRPLILQANGLRIGVIALADHPADYAATRDGPGIAYADLRRSSLPAWVPEQIARAEVDVVLVTPHWGPNMVADPVPHVRSAAGALLEGGVHLIAGHSAHVFHGVEGRDGAAALYDLGDFLDDYATHPLLRNDLALLWLVELDERGPLRVEVIPLALDYCFTRLAGDSERRWIRSRFSSACRGLGTRATEQGDRMVVSLRHGGDGSSFRGWRG